MEKPLFSGQELLHKEHLRHNEIDYKHTQALAVCDWAAKQSKIIELQESIKKQT